MQVQFWGTRGSIPKPGPTTIRYGGDTLCVEVRTARGTLVVLDCGTGLHGLDSFEAVHCDEHLISPYEVRENIAPTNVAHAAFLDNVNRFVQPGS